MSAESFLMKMDQHVEEQWELLLRYWVYGEIHPERCKVTAIASRATLEREFGSSSGLVSELEEIWTGGGVENAKDKYERRLLDSYHMLLGVKFEAMMPGSG